MKPDVYLRHMDNHLTMTVTISSELKFRIWVATQLIKLAAWILRANLDIRS